MEHRIKAADGRVLAVQEAGDPGGKPVLAHNGTPNSRQIYAPTAADAAARGIRLISYDRPGYGGSDPLPGRTTGRTSSCRSGTGSGWPRGYRARRPGCSTTTGT
jgi:pimeloyl-ACP methyl ester carboxylesterase